MAAAVIGGAFLSGFVEIMLDKIISHEFMDLFKCKKLDLSLLEKLKVTLMSLEAVLNDAEEKQITNSAVKTWLDELTYAVFDADDLLDKINTEALRCKVEAKVRRNVLNFSFPFKWSYRVINAEIQKVFERLQHFAQQTEILKLKEGASSSSSIWHGTTTPTGSVVDESAIYGRDEDKEKLKDYLMSNYEDATASGTSKIGVVTIVGMGGVGKTTLAKLLYNDQDVKEKFNLKAWAHIAKGFDVCRVTKTILESVTSKTIHTDNLDSLQVELQQSLSHKRFLLVLDDIWDGSYDDWNNLNAIFNAGETGSKIIITTRDESIALAMKTFLPIYHLASLDGEDCWSLLAKHAFGANECSEERSNFEVIGKEIAKKCDGLPLAAVALGGLLRTKLSKDHWNRVLKSDIWVLPKVKVLPALLLSYHYLPSPLKRCFAYCSIFPKNYRLEKDMVVQLWIAEGLIHQSKSENTMEEVGGEYFDELVSRSLILRQSMNREAKFEMHDLINDLATMVSSAYCIRYEDQKQVESLNKVRHLSYQRGTYDYFNKFDTLHGSKGLRTFLALPLREMWWPSSYLASNVVHDLLPSMSQLRVLSLSYYTNITMLPNSLLENLTHLRYLNLSYTGIVRLPSVTCKLYNLQTLLLSNCVCLIELPKDMGKLANLRHLDISGTRLKEMPVQIARLENLQTLSDFIVSKKPGELKVAMLRKFPCLQGKLSILKLQNVTDPYDAFQANLKKKEQIEELSLGWDDCNSTAEDSQLDVLEHLQPSTNLKKLTIEFYGGTSFPNWFGDSSFGNMVYLCIRGCDHCWSLPPLGQLICLKELKICSLKSVKTVGTEFYGIGSSSSTSFQPFPSLEILEISGMLEWEEWNSIGGTATEFPSLKQLFLCDCPKLKGNLPSNLPSLVKFELKCCPRLKGNLPSNHPSLTELELCYNSNPLESQHSDEVDNNNIIRPLMLPLNCLRRLTLKGIPSLTSFQNIRFSPTLVSLKLLFCENLEFLPHESLHSLTSLEFLQIIRSCNSLTSFSLGCLPVLKSLHISGCKNLRSISIADDSSHSLSFLQSFTLDYCSNLESFPPGGFFPTPNLIRFHVSHCENLKSLPEPIHTLKSLHYLRLFGLPNLQSFAQQGLPINLSILVVNADRWTFLNTATARAVREWGLQHLTCLSKLRIGGDELVNAVMKMEVPLLPTSLVSLVIYNLDGIKYLNGKWLQHLTSLQNLEISGCSSLEMLPREGLPSSLAVLTINRCPSLEASCRRKLGKEWPKIAHIPCIIINEQVII